MNAGDKKVFIHPSAEVHPNADIGDGTYIWNGGQVRERSKIGEKCNFGKDVYVDVDVAIGDRVRVQNGVSIYKGVHLADDVFVGPNVCFTNDMYPRAFNGDWQIVETWIEEGASLGAASIIVCGVTVGCYALVGVAAVVTRDVPPHGLVMGNPARLKDYVCKCGKPFKADELDVVKTYKCTSCGYEVSLPMK